MPIRVLLCDQVMSAFGAEMRNVDDGGRVVSQNTQNGSTRHGFKAFAGF